LGWCIDPPVHQTNPCLQREHPMVASQAVEAYSRIQ
jgi:hypothetical protein